MNTFIIERLKQKFPLGLVYHQGSGALTIEVPTADLLPVATFLKTNPDFNFSNLLTVFPYQEQFCYLLQNPLNKNLIALRTTGDSRPSLARIWPTSELLEREAGLTSPTTEAEDHYTLTPSQHNLGLPLLLHLTTRDGTIISARPEYGLFSHGLSQQPADKTMAAFIKELGTLDWAGPASQLAFLGAIEQALGQTVPQGAALIRTLMLELCRLGAAFDSLGRRLHFLGLSQLYQQLIPSSLQLARLLTAIPQNGRLLTYPVFGGVASPPAPGALSTISAAMESCRPLLEKVENELSNNQSIQLRLAALGTITKEQATSFGLIGSDLRQSRPYWGYELVTVPPLCLPQNSAYDRLFWLLADMERSRQLITATCSLAAKATTFNSPAPTPEWPDCHLPEALISHTLVGPSGNLTATMAFDAESRPLVFDLRTQSFFNLALVTTLLPGLPLSDMSHLFASLVILPNEIDR